MTNKEFQRLLDMAISRGNLNEVGLDKVYVMLTWWNDEFRPLITLDGNWRTGEKICVFGSKEDSCNKWHDGLPCAFWIASDAVRIEQVTHRPRTLSTLYGMQGDNENAPRKFLISDSPKNLFVDINPSRTRIIRNWEGETMLCFYVDDNSGERHTPFERMTEDSIEVIDAREEVGEYKYGAWIVRQRRGICKECKPDSNTVTCEVVPDEKEESRPRGED
jgi:hypothetical protein